MVEAAFYDSAPERLARENRSNRENRDRDRNKGTHRFLNATPEIRFILKTVDNQNRRILQQKFFEWGHDHTIREEWRDVPLVTESEPEKNIGQ
jgi:hypothetical protein